jgi:hydrogenase maturation protease
MTDGPVVVIGLGNPLMGDDGLGLAALDRLDRGWDPGPGVVLVDGGTWGMNLLPMIEDAGRLVLLDAIDTGTTPGTLVELDRPQIPRYLATKISPHQVDLRDVLALAELRRTLPDDTVAVGLQPARVALGDTLSSVVAAALPTLVERVAQMLAERGSPCRAREPVHA